MPRYAEIKMNHYFFLDHILAEAWLKVRDTIHSVAKLAFMRSLLTALGREKDQQRLLLIENHLSEGN